MVLIDEVEASLEVKNLIEKLKKDFIVLIVSNSPKKRVSLFAKQLNIETYSFALKPSIRTLKQIKKKYNLQSSDIAIIGDQFITDMGYGYKGKITKIFVDSIGPKDLKITDISRFIEKKIMNKYANHNLFKKGIYYDKR